MRKTLFISIVICHISISLFGQVYGEKDTFAPKIVPPNAGHFQTVDLTNVSTYQGTANINVPIHTIQVGKISVPISIGYQTSGVRSNQVSSNIGQNWSLNAGGKVMKIIKGQEDFSIKFKQVGGIESIGWLLQSSDQFFSGSTYTVDQIAQDSSIDRDVSPDLFVANAPGLNSKFTHRFGGVVQEIEKRGHQINTTIGESDNINVFGNFYNTNFPFYIESYYASSKLQCVNHIDITTTSGVKYVFNDLDVVQYIQRDALNPPSNNIQLTTSQEVSSYNLSSIEDTEGNKVDFIYEKYQIANSEFEKSAQLELTTNETYTTNNLLSTEIKYPQLNRLKRIEYRSGSVEFDYSKSREDLLGDFALTQITVKDIHNKVIKTVKLTQNYFISNNECLEATCKRLKLEEITVEGRDGLKMPPYRFFYNETKLPERGSHYVDFLGYANAQVPSQFHGTSVVKNSQTTLLPPPKVYFYPYKKRFSFSPFEIYSNSYSPPGGTSLDPNLSMSQAGVLNKIEQPTGVTEEFIYELNTFITAEGQETIGGGLRVKKTILVDAKNRITQKRYHYIDEQGNTSGYINNLPLYGSAEASGIGYDIKDGNVQPHILTGNIRLKYYTAPKSNIAITHGSFVGYSRVLIEENQNGYSEFIYTSPKDYPLEEPEFYSLSGLASGEVEIEYAYNNGGFFPHFNDRDILLGNLIEKREFDANNELLSESVMDFKYRVFETNIQPIKVYRSQIITTSPQADYSLEFIGKVYTHRNLMSLNEQKSFLNNQEIVKTTKYRYHHLYPFVQSVQNTGSHSDESQITRYFYPFQTDYFENTAVEKSAYESLTNANNIGEPVFVESVLQKVGVIEKVFLSKQQTVFSGGLPSEIKAVKGEETLESRIFLDGYDNFGNINALRKAQDMTISYIWGYQNSFPIAKLDDISYSDIPSTLITEVQDASNLDNDNCHDASCNEEKLRVSLQKLRDLFPNAQVTTYTHDPHIGITSITDPKGNTNYFEYDGLNRLLKTTDYQFNILSKYYYNHHKL